MKNKIFKKQIENGISLLDKKYPDWFLKINEQNLYMQFGGYCILGQLYGMFAKGLESIQNS